MRNLKTIDIKAFIPAKDFETSTRFYVDIGFTQASIHGGVAFFHCGGCNFLLQDFYDKGLAENLMMHLQVEDAQAWHQQLQASKVVEKYNVKMSDVIEQPWGMLDFCLHDPSGVLWRIAQNL